MMKINRNIFLCYEWRLTNLKMRKKLMKIYVYFYNYE